MCLPSMGKQMGNIRKPRLYGRLAPLSVRRLKSPGYHADGAGLYLQVGESGSRSWVLKFTLFGRKREMGLGSVNTYDLGEARERAKQYRQMVDAGIDPIEHRRNELAQAALDAGQRKNFEEATTEYIKLHRATWRSAKHPEDWRASLTTYAFPYIGKRDVDTITRGDVVSILDPIWTTKTETATRVRQRIRAVLDWAAAKGWRRSHNPVLWDEVDRALPKAAKVKKVTHFAACPHADVPAFIQQVRASTSGDSVKLAMEFGILTAARSSELRGATWTEFDLQRKVWVLPAERMKAHKEHRVPLSDRCIEILQAARKLHGGELVFPSPTGKVLSDMTLTKLIRTLGHGFTQHGFRSTFRDWAGETTGHPRDVIEAALAHQLQDKTEAAYFRSDLFEKRRLLMDDWARHCAGGAA